MNRPLIAIGLLALTALAGVAAVHARTDDRLDAIASELRRGVDDPANTTEWATLVRAEFASVGRRQTFTAAMPCFWSGEGRFGRVVGVFRTTPGYQDGKEVVRVEYDPTLTSAEALRTLNNTATAEHGDICQYNASLADASRKAGAFRADDQPHWYLQQTALRFVPMTPAQATRINADLHADKPVEPLLSPLQRAMLAEVRAKPGFDGTQYVGDDSLWERLTAAAVK